MEQNKVTDYFSYSFPVVSSLLASRTVGSQVIDHIIERTTPPSARSAAAFVAEDVGLATIAARVATASGVANRLNSELGRIVSKHSFSTAARSTLRDVAMWLTNPSPPSDLVGPGKMELTVTPVPAVVSARPRANASCMVFVTP